MTNNNWSVNFVLGDNDAVIKSNKVSIHPFELEVLGCYIDSFDDLEEAFIEAEKRLDFVYAVELVEDELVKQEEEILSKLDELVILGSVIPVLVRSQLESGLYKELNAVRDLIDTLYKYTYDNFQDDMYDEEFQEELEELEELEEELDGVNEDIEEIKELLNQEVVCPLSGPFSVI